MEVIYVVEVEEVRIMMMLKETLGEKKNIGIMETNVSFKSCSKCWEQVEKENSLGEQNYCYL